MKEICDDPNITLNEEIYHSESRTGDINRSLAYYMKGNQMIEGDVPEILDAYFRQCSLNVTATGIAKLAAVLANKELLLGMANKSLLKKVLQSSNQL